VAVASFATLLAGAAQAAGRSMSGEGAAFPPFDPSHFASNLFWLAITFSALYWLMSKIALPRVGDHPGERANDLADLDQAAQMQAKAEETAQAYEKALAEARKNAQASPRRLATPAPRHRRARHAVEAELMPSSTRRKPPSPTPRPKAMSNVRGLGSEVAVAIVDQADRPGAQRTEASDAIDQAGARLRRVEMDTFWVGVASSSSSPSSSNSACRRRS
jgi:F-type H+-transporting ATPase subunit b